MFTWLIFVNGLLHASYTDEGKAKAEARREKSHHHNFVVLLKVQGKVENWSH